MRVKQPYDTKLTTAEQHQKKIALDTLKMPDAMVAVMGGMTKAEAVAFLTSLANPDRQR